MTCTECDYRYLFQLLNGLGMGVCTKEIETNDRLWEYEPFINA